MTTGRINQVAAILRTPPAAPSRKQPTPAKGIRRPEPHDWMSVVLAWKRGIHPQRGCSPTEGATARTAFRLCSTEHPTQAPSTLRNAGTLRVAKVREFPSAGLLRWQPTAPNKLLREEELFRRSRRPSRASLGFQSGLHIVYRHKLPAPRSRTAPLERSRTKRPQDYSEWIESPHGQALKRASGLARPGGALTPPDRAPPRPTVTHHPRRGQPSASCSDAPAASLLVSSSATDWSPASPSSGLVSRF